MWLAELSLLAVVLGAGASIIWSTLRLGISPMPTSAAVRRVLLELVPPTQQGEVHELGAGWGTLAFALADRCPGARVVAWEASCVPFLWLWLRARVRPRRNLELRRADFFAGDLRPAALVVCYLWTGAMERLGPKFDAELQPGASVVSHTFALRGRTPVETRRANDLYRTLVWHYLWPA